MNKIIIGLFENSINVEDAINALHTEGFNPKNVSIVMKDKNSARKITTNTGANTQNVVSGAATGVVVGGIAGFLATSFVPGLGGFLIAGPIGAAFGLTGAAAAAASGIATGAVAGGLIGGLMGFGLTHEEATHYETRLNEGEILVAVPCSTSEVGLVTDIFDEFDASDVKIITTNETDAARVVSRRYRDAADEDVRTPRRHHYTHSA